MEMKLAGHLWNTAPLGTVIARLVGMVLAVFPLFILDMYMD